MKKIWIIAKKELANYFYNPLGYLAAGALIVLCNWLFFNNIFVINQADMGNYWGTATFLLSLFIPAMTMGLFADEKKNNTWEVLKSLPITHKDIVWGKFIGSLLFILFTLALTLPIAGSLAIIGKPQIGLIIGGYLGVILLSTAYLALGLFISSLCSQPLVAFLITSVLLIVNNLLTQFKIFTDFSLSFRSAKFSSGLIDFGDLLFFISWILIFVIGTIMIRKKRNFITINFLIILILANVLLTFYPSFKLDLTKDKVHSLSPTSKEIVKNLDDIVNIKVLMSANLPTETKVAVDKLKAILDEFGRINRKKLIISYVDPEKDGMAKSMIASLGIQPIQFNSIKKDKVELQSGYFSVVLIYGQKQQVLNLDLQNMEYLIVSGIKKLLNNKQPSVALYEEEDLKYFKQYLSKDYDVYKVDIFSKDKLPEVDTLVIDGLTKKLDEKTLTKLQDWVKAKKGLIVFLDKIAVSDRMESAKIEKTGLEQIFSDNDITISDKLVLDASCGIANFNTKDGLIYAQYQFWPKIMPENINSKLPLMSGIDSLQLAWASPLEVGKNATALFSTSKNAEVTENIGDLSPIIKVGTGIKAQSILGAINVSDGKKLALIGDADFIKDNFIVSNDRNLYFAINLVDYFSTDSSLMSIRSKSLRISPLKELDDNKKLVTRVVNIALPVFILGIVGLVIIKRRKYLNSMDYEE